MTEMIVLQDCQGLIGVGSWTITELVMTQKSFHPGEHIQEELDQLSLSPDAFASQLGISLRVLVDVLQERERVTAEFALRLGHFFGTSAQFWLNLQQQFDLEVAERLHGAEIDALPTLQTA